jgi:hypothetical protein
VLHQQPAIGHFHGRRQPASVCVCEQASAGYLFSQGPLIVTTWHVNQAEEQFRACGLSYPQDYRSPRDQEVRRYKAVIPYAGRLAGLESLSHASITPKPQTALQKQGGSWGSVPRHIRLGNQRRAKHRSKAVTRGSTCTLGFRRVACQLSEMLSIRFPECRLSISGSQQFDVGVLFVSCSHVAQDLQPLTSKVKDLNPPNNIKRRRPRLLLASSSGERSF